MKNNHSLGCREIISSASALDLNHSQQDKMSPRVPTGMRDEKTSPAGTNMETRMGRLQRKLFTNLLFPA